ncbi:hypothetical protein GOODEAATRI_027850 [Goodea atripinnis]|uniref:Uncharacterized protein n=1 Tax=Goodea atripinnis TaxID=208336 RepID=A0ABV0N4V0_9TELE
MASKQSEEPCGDMSSEDQRGGFLARFREFKPKEVLTRQLAKTLAMGQGLAGLICGTAVTSQYLATEFHLNTPMLQSFLNYMLLCITYTIMLFCRRGSTNANSLNACFIQNISIFSDILLDCFVIPVLMVLSWWILKTRYRLIHYVAVGICLLGVGAMVGADLLARRDQGSMMKLSSATSVNLSLLTADLFSLFLGIFLFQYSVSDLTHLHIYRRVNFHIITH